MDTAGTHNYNNNILYTRRDSSFKNARAVH